MQDVPKEAGQRTSILQVARRVGVSHSTVSRALAGDPRITADTAERVREAAAALGYRPNRLARGLKRGQPPVIGVLNFSITQPFYAMIVRAFENRTRSEGLATVVCDTGRDDATEREALDFLLELPVRGVLLVGNRRRSASTNEMLAQVWRTGMPVATIAGGVYGTDIPRVSVDNERVGYLATRHLLDCGHRRIAHVTAGLSANESTSTWPVARVDGYRRALDEAGFTPDCELVIRIPDVTRGAADDALTGLLSLPESPTAVFASRDEVALAVIGAAQARGLRVPEDLAVVGVDDLPIGSLTWPSLTTIGQPVDEMATLALECLIRAKDAPPLRLLEPKLIVRESSAHRGDVRLGAGEGS